MWPVILLGAAAVLWFGAMLCDASGLRYTAILLGLMGAASFGAMLGVLLTQPRAAAPAPPPPLPSHGPTCVNIAWLDESWKCIPADQAG